MFSVLCCLRCRFSALKFFFLFCYYYVLFIIVINFFYLVCLQFTLSGMHSFISMRFQRGKQNGNFSLYARLVVAFRFFLFYAQFGLARAMELTTHAHTLNERERERASERDARDCLFVRLGVCN